GEFTVLVEGLLSADRRDDDRGVISHAQNIGRHVDLADVDEPTRPQLEFQEPLAIGAKRHLVIDPGGHVAEMRGRNVLPADRLEIEHVDGLLGRFDALVGTHGRPRQWVGKFAPRREFLASKGSAGGEQRTCGQEFKKLAPAGGMIGERWHGGPSLERLPRGPTLSAGMDAAGGPSYTSPKSTDNRPTIAQRAPHAHRGRKARNVPHTPFR